MGTVMTVTPCDTSPMPCRKVELHAAVFERRSTSCSVPSSLKFTVQGLAFTSFELPVVLSTSSSRWVKLWPGVQSEACCFAYLPYVLSAEFQENERQPFLVLGLWGLLVSWMSQKFPCLRPDPTVLYNALFPDFSHVVCDRLSVDIMND